MFLHGFASFYGLLAVRIRKVRAAGPVGFSLVLLCSKHDFTCFYKVLLAFMGSCRSEEKGAHWQAPQVSLAFPFGFRARVRTLVTSPIQFCVK